MRPDYYYKVPGPKVCSQCGSWEELQVHHKNGNHKDDRPINLQWRCRVKCHGRDAHKRFIPATPRFKTPQSQRFENENEDLSFGFKVSLR